MYFGDRSKFGPMAACLTLGIQGASAGNVCKGEKQVDATYDFGKFDENFVKMVRPTSGCNLVLQTRGDGVSVILVIGNLVYVELALSYLFVSPTALRYIKVERDVEKYQSLSVLRRQSAEHKRDNCAQ